MNIRRARLIAVGAICITLLATNNFANAAGRSTTALINTILNGKGAPKNSSGINGDFYIDTRSLLLYGPKSKGKWPSPQSIQGPIGPSGVAGASGSDGKNGTDGKAISSANINAAAGPVGAQGLQGIAGAQGLTGATGPAGAQGLTGATGPAGNSGANGSTGATGLQGLTGAAGVQGLVGLTGVQGLTGAQGLTGTTGAQGLIGLTGAPGASGAKGETGTVGPSEVSIVDIPSWNLSTSMPFTYSSSVIFGVFKPGNSYKFDIYVFGSSVLSNLVLGFDALVPNSMLSTSYIRSEARYASYNATSYKYSFHLTGVASDIQVLTGMTLRVIDAYGETWGGSLILSGKAYITLVGTIR